MRSAVGSSKSCANASRACRVGQRALSRATRLVTWGWIASGAEGSDAVSVCSRPAPATVRPGEAARPCLEGFESSDVPLCGSFAQERREEEPGDWGGDQHHDPAGRHEQADADGEANQRPELLLTCQPEGCPLGPDGARGCRLRLVGQPEDDDDPAGDGDEDGENDSCLVHGCSPLTA